MYSEKTHNENARLGVAAYELYLKTGSVLPVPLSLFYSTSVYWKAIKPISELPFNEKMYYWTKAKNAEPGAVKFRKIILAQSYYLIDLLNKTT